MIRRHFIINNNDNDNGDNIIIYTTLNSNIFNMNSLQQSLLASAQGIFGVHVPILPKIVSNTYNEYGVIKFNAPITNIGISLYGILTGIDSIGPLFAQDEESPLTTVILPPTVTTINEEAFKGCTTLTSINIPNSVTSIGDDVFKECYSLKSITIGSGVVNIPRDLFYDCTSLESITIEDGLEDIYGDLFDNTAFYKNESNWHEGILCINNHLISAKTNISSYIMPHNIVNIATDAFRDCTLLTSISLSNSLRKIPSYAFTGCSALASITIPNSVTSIGEQAFNGCESLTSVTIPNSVTSIGYYAFFHTSWEKEIFFLGTIEDWCKVSLQSELFGYYLYLNGIKAEDIVIPDTISNINDYLFYGCYSLTSVTLSNGVTSIGNRVFWSCESLTSITIPNSVTSIGEMALAHSGKLKNINFNGTSNLWLLITKGDNWRMGVPATVVHCSDGDVSP